MSSQSLPQNNQNDLSTIIPAPQSKEIAGVIFEFSPIRVSKISRLAAAITPIFHLFNESGKIDLIAAVIGYSEHCLNVLEVLTGQSRAWVDELDLADTVELLTLFLEVNVDFLLQRVLPQLPQLVATLANLRSQAEKMTNTKVGQTTSKP